MGLGTTAPVVVAAVEDMFFSTKIEAEARRAGVTLRLALDENQLSEHLKVPLPALILIDLNNRSCDPIQSIRRIKEDPFLAGVPVIGFFSHVQVELERSARGVGCDQVLARSVFFSRLQAILSDCRRR
jgi:CheY-like chemotaxis protein